MQVRLKYSAVPYVSVPRKGHVTACSLNGNPSLSILRGKRKVCADVKESDY